MTTFATIPLDKIQIHPDNVRRDAFADEELVESIRSQGILQPVGVVEEAGQYLLIAGHRRYSGAVQAGLTALPAVILDHLTTRAQQIEAMLVENGRRVDLTPMEEAKAYEQLTLEGYKPKDIAKATGRALATVQSRLKLNALTDTAQGALHTHQITLDDAAAMADLEAFPHLLAEVEAAIGTDNFAWAVRNAARRVESEKEWAMKRAEYEAAGLTKIEHPGAWDYDKGPCPATWRTGMDADAWADGVSGPVLVITKVAAKPVDSEAAARRAQEDEERRLAQAERDEKNRQLDIAADLRATHLLGILSPTRIPTDGVAFLREAMARKAEFAPDEEIARYTGVSLVRQKPHWQADADLGAAVHDLTVHQLTSYALGSAIVQTLEDTLTAAIRRGDGELVLAGLSYLQLLEDSGHTFSDIDNEIRDTLTDRAENGEAAA